MISSSAPKSRAIATFRIKTKKNFFKCPQIKGYRNFQNQTKKKFFKCPQIKGYHNFQNQDQEEEFLQVPPNQRLSQLSESRPRRISSSAPKSKAIATFRIKTMKNFLKCPKSKAIVTFRIKTKKNFFKCPQIKGYRNFQNQDQEEFLQAPPNQRLSQLSESRPIRISSSALKSKAIATFRIKTMKNFPKCPQIKGYRNFQNQDQEEFLQVPPNQRLSQLSEPRPRRSSSSAPKSKAIANFRIKSKKKFFNCPQTRGYRKFQNQDQEKFFKCPQIKGYRNFQNQDQEVFLQVPPNQRLSQLSESRARRSSSSAPKSKAIATFRIKTNKKFFKCPQIKGYRNFQNQDQEEFLQLPPN